MLPRLAAALLVLGLTTTGCSSSPLGTDAAQTLFVQFGHAATEQDLAALRAAGGEIIAQADIARLVSLHATGAAERFRQVPGVLDVRTSGAVGSAFIAVADGAPAAADLAFVRSLGDPGAGKLGEHIGATLVVDSMMRLSAYPRFTDVALDFTLMTVRSAAKLAPPNR